MRDMSEMTGSGGSILPSTVAENSSFCSDLSQTQISGWMAHFESLFSNPSVPFVGFLCGPTTTNKSLPTSFPAPQQFQGMAVWQRHDGNFTLWRKGFGGRSLLETVALSTSYQLWIERGNWAAQQRLMGLLMFSKSTVWGCLSDGEHGQGHLACWVACTEQDPERRWWVRPSIPPMLCWQQRGPGGTVLAEKGLKTQRQAPLPLRFISGGLFFLEESHCSSSLTQHGDLFLIFTKPCTS